MYDFFDDDHIPATQRTQYGEDEAENDATRRTQYGEDEDDDEIPDTSERTINRLTILETSEEEEEEEDEKNENYNSDSDTKKITSKNCSKFMAESNEGFNQSFINDKKSLYENPRIFVREYRMMQNNNIFQTEYHYNERLTRFDNLIKFINLLTDQINENYVCIKTLAHKTISSAGNINFDQLKMYTADVAASMTHIHHDYALLAGRLLVVDLHKKIEPSFVKVMSKLCENGIISKKFNSVVMKYKYELDNVIRHDRDFQYKYFGLKTLINGYLLKSNDQVAERPQHMLMRVALSIHSENIDDAIETYHLMSLGMFTHASPTLFSAGTVRPQMSSCFLQCIIDDNVSDIYKTVSKCAIISQHGGGIGLSVQNVRARGSKINNCTGVASGVVPMLRVFNNMLRHIDQGGKRKGALAAFIEPWHADIYDVLNIKRNMGVEEAKARDIMLGLWIPDIFMKRVQNDEKWSLMCPNTCPDLVDSYGEKFEKLYKNYEKDNMFVKQVKARDLFRFIVETNVETGGPYMMYKDACNRFNMQQNLGTIRGSNLCAEIVQYSDAKETAVCTLASIAVNKCVKNKIFDYQLLMLLVKVAVRNLNKIIDINVYPTKEAAASSKKHRPIGVGIQGLADAFVLMDLPYDSEYAKGVNLMIAQAIYYGALEASCELARVHGPYQSYKDSPASKGILHHDYFGVDVCDLWNWPLLRENISKYGLRNSVLVAYMPTATTAQILGNNESFEPFTSNVYVRRVLAGEFQVVNQYLIDKLIELNIYTPELRNRIMAENGSIQNIDEIPDDVKELFKTSWEIKSKSIIEMAADRAPFVDQSQSLNLFVAKPTYAVLSSIHFYAWEKKLKTGMYYLRTKPAAQTIQFTVDKQQLCKKKRNSDGGDDGNVIKKKNNMDGVACQSCEA